MTPDNFFTAETPNELIDIFKQENDMEPKDYYNLAISKLSNELTQKQESILKNSTKKTWEQYCKTLTVEQVKFVGW